MINDAMQKAINDQINEELYSEYLYLAMAAWFDEQNLPGFSRWMRLQAAEERMHAMKFFDYVLERGGSVQLQAIKAPEIAWDTPLSAFEAAFGHEQHITGCINDLIKLSREENDPASESMLKWFVDEQVEEEATAEGIWEQFKLIGDNGYGVLMLDRELAQRTFTMPPAGGGAEA